ncbi:DUF1254 domain-containing protein [Lysobacter sp. TAF61]|uniref:DUF1254 domain-containing protein n=1 Tax=Lysobacter sp. TAF61 TaxID=3233072 RepID=UPI003F9858E2
MSSLPFRRLMLATAVSVVMAATVTACKKTETAPTATSPAATDAASDAAHKANVDLVADAYLFGYPLVLVDVTRAVSTNVADASDGEKAPTNQFLHKREFPDYTFTDVVSPNADTLYSIAWLDLSKEPMVLSVPDMGKRFYMMEMMGAWTDVFASPGSRTTGTGKGDFAVVGPGWKGTLPEGLKTIQSPTNLVWLIGRTQTNGKSDYKAVHAIQDKYRLVPLSGWGKPYQAPTGLPVAADIDMKTPPPAQVASMDAATFFGRLNRLMQDNPPSAADAPALERFAKLGIAPGKPFDAASLDPAVAAALDEGMKAGREKLIAETKAPRGKEINGWTVLPPNVANFGTDYSTRAVVALVGLGANLPSDAIYPHAVADSDGQPLNGANRYTMKFAKGQLPPVKAFWSITTYNDKQAFIQNPINRYAIGDRDKLRFDPDGSLTLYIQKDSPGKDKEANWLPVPEGSFNLFMRLYWPEQTIVDGTWKMPPVERVK